jgi:hypothetical protein
MRLKLDLAQRCTAVMALVAFVDRLGAVDLLDRHSLQTSATHLSLTAGPGSPAVNGRRLKKVNDRRFRLADAATPLL